MKESLEVKQALQNLDERITSTGRNVEDWVSMGEDWLDPSWAVESCFLELMAISESLGLAEFRRMLESEYSAIRGLKGGFSAVESGGPDNEPYLIVLGRIRCFSCALEDMFPKETSTTVTKDLLQIIRDIHYAITDKGLFRTAPADEADVHKRIEGILKPVFPDLKNKPALTKQIKNFVPDTGIPSLETLVEYKFLAAKEDAPRIADELLADTRGYTSRDWKRFLYVIYETHRFKTEKDWNQLLRESGVPENTSVVVLSGEPPRKKRIQRNRSQEKPKLNSDASR